jgi:hypothetical protein
MDAKAKKAKKKNKAGQAMRNIDQSKLKEMFKFYEENSGSCEVVADDIVEKVWFIKMPYFKFFRSELKTDFDNEVDRSTYRNKIIALLSNVPRFINISQMGYNIDKGLNKIFIFNVFYKYKPFFADLGLWLA